MKKLLIPFIAVVLMAASCGDNPSISHDTSKGNIINPENKSSSSKFTTIEQIDTFSVEVDLSIVYEKLERYHPYLYSNKDAVFLWKQDGELKRLTTGLFERNVESRSFFYVDGGEIVMFRRRAWYHSDNPPYASEFLCYMSNGKVIKATERKVQLSPGQKPGSLLSQEFVPAKVDNDSLMNAIMSDFLKYKNATDTCRVKELP